MSKVQMNVRVPKHISQRVDVERGNLPFTKDEIVGSIVHRFFKTHRKADRLRIYREFRHVYSAPSN